MNLFGESKRARVRGLAVLASLLGVAVLVAACTGATGGSAVKGSTSPAGNVDSSSSSPSSSAAAAPAVIALSAATTSTKKISPAAPISVSVTAGRLTSVTLVNPEGKHVTGEISTDGTSWKTTEALGYSKTYKLTADAVNADGVSTEQKTSFTTLTPNNMTMPYLQRIGGYSLKNGATYGVAIVPVVHFDEPITDRAAAERALSVTSTPAVTGAWDWIDDQNVHYRPQTYWPSGTKVTIKANVYGVRVGSGLYGQSDVSTSFTIGRRQVTIAYDTAPKSVNKVRVYNAAGHVIRTMNTSMGKHSGETVNGQWINFYTLDGTYTVLAHEQPAKMCSASYGLPATAPGGYACESIYNATKISIDGIYLHELLTTIWAQNNGYDVSHGCLNLNSSNSLWFFDHSMIGDPVEIHAAKGAPTLSVWQGGDWTVPWSTWVKGSALS